MRRSIAYSPVRTIIAAILRIAATATSSDAHRELVAEHRVAELLAPACNGYNVYMYICVGVCECVRARVCGNV